MLELEALLVDAPGSLFRFIKPLSDNGANIQGILHFHDKKTKDNMIPVLVTFELPDDIEERLAKIKDELESDDVHIVRVMHKPARELLTVIVIGHVFETDFVDTMKKISEPGIQVRGIRAAFTNPQEISTVKFSIWLDHVNLKPRAMEIVERICTEKNLFMVAEA